MLNINSKNIENIKNRVQFTNHYSQSEIFNENHVKIHSVPNSGIKSVFLSNGKRFYYKNQCLWLSIIDYLKLVENSERKKSLMSSS